VEWSLRTSLWKREDEALCRPADTVNRKQKEIATWTLFLSAFLSIVAMKTANFWLPFILDAFPLHSSVSLPSVSPTNMSLSHPHLSYFDPEEGMSSFSEILIPTYKTAQYNNPEDCSMISGGCLKE
jgi:hypothetical protein